MITVGAVEDSSLSRAWAKAFLQVMDASGGSLHPCIVAITGLEIGEELENQWIRALLDAELKRRGQSSCASVAGTIFPASMWNPRLKNDADILFGRYEKAWLGIRKCPANRNGVYFRRLMAFDSREASRKPINQLRFIIDTYKGGNHRKSALQAAILDPRKDHANSRQKGFPCLQQVAFTPVSESSMTITGFYATQYQFEKAYGNYLGLYNLGKFMAKQLGLELTQVVCIANFLKIGNVGKSELRAFADRIRDCAEKARG